MNSILALGLIASLAIPDTGLARASLRRTRSFRAAIGRTFRAPCLSFRGMARYSRACLRLGGVERLSGSRLPSPRPMHTSTIFDLASVTKVMATTMAVMMLVSRSRIDVDAPVYRYLPDFRGAHLDSITVGDLLTHSAGLVQWQPLYYHASNEHETYEVIRHMPLQWGVGEARHYSDLGFMLLGYIVERLRRQPLDQVSRRVALHAARASLDDLSCRSRTASRISRRRSRETATSGTWCMTPRSATATAATQRHGMAGVSMCSTAKPMTATRGMRTAASPDMPGCSRRRAISMSCSIMLLARGGAGGPAVHPPAGHRPLPHASTATRITSAGWRRTRLPPGSFSHTGFTGTYVLGVPKYGLSIVLLTNRQNMGTDARGYFPTSARCKMRSRARSSRARRRIARGSRRAPDTVTERALSARNEEGAALILRCRSRSWPNDTRSTAGCRNPTPEGYRRPHR